jgi:hypothetical protein
MVFPCTRYLRDFVLFVVIERCMHYLRLSIRSQVQLKNNAEGKIGCSVCGTWEVLFLLMLVCRRLYLRPVDDACEAGLFVYRHMGFQINWFGGGLFTIIALN